MTRPLDSGPARRYALALLAEAEATKVVDKVAADLAALEATLAASAELTAALNHPLLSEKAFSGLFAELAKKAKCQKLTTTFLQLLARNNRAGLLPQVCAWFAKLLAESRGEETVTVLTPTPLTKAQRSSLEKFAKSQLPNANVVKLVEETQPGLLGGVKVRLGAQEIDLSLQGALQRLKNRLTA